MKPHKTISEVGLPTIKKDPGMERAIREACKAHGISESQLLTFIRNGTWRESRILRNLLEEPIRKYEEALNDGA